MNDEIDHRVIAPKQKPSFLFSVRFLVSILGFLLTAIQYMQRINMSVAIVCMINNTRLAEINGEKKSFNKQISLSISDSFSNLTPTNQQCAYQKTKDTKLDGEFVWDKSIQGVILSSFFYGYLFTQIIGAWLAIRFGPKIVLGSSILLSSVLTLLTPLAARIHYVALFICRFLIGFVHGVVWPSLGGLWPYWAPPDERSTIMSIASAGSQIGNVVTLPLGGFLCAHGFDGGWPSIFYVIGSIGILWCLLWFFLLSNTPEKNRLISIKEKLYIVEATKDSVLSSSSKKKKRTPFIEIITCKAFYGLLITHTCSNFGTYLFLTQMPSYMSEILNFDIKSNGGLSSIPYLAFWLFTVLSGIVSDKIIQTGKLSRIAVRKLFNTAGFFVPAIAVVCLMFVDCQRPYIGVFLITLGLAFSGFTYGAGFLVNYNDIGGTFSGIVFGISNTIGTISGIVAPYLVGLLTPNKRQEEWRIVFIITALIYVIGALGFVILAQGETQKWATNSNSRAEKNQDLDNDQEADENQRFQLK